MERGFRSVFKRYRKLHTPSDKSETPLKRGQSRRQTFINMARKVIPYNPKLKELARNLRNNSTKAENVLWLCLKGKQMNGYDFHRQKPINNFILDLFCHELMLGIEVDGYTHQSEETYIKDELKERKMNLIDELPAK